MDASLISEIRSFTLTARGILEREADEQLQGIYGWLPDGTFASTKPYPAVVELQEARETRERLERFAQDEKAAGLDSKAARTKLKREAAFTWLNRLVAFRLMEERNLLKPTIVKLDKSNAFIYWLTLDDANKEEYALYQQGSLPVNSIGEGPSNVAYRRFILWQCGELARDVSVLFDPTTLASRLFPRPTVVKQLVADMTAEVLVEAWQSGNEETIGWVYQAFNAKELQAAFASAREQGKKFEPEDIPAVTQLFTIRWVVRFLVQNTLGRLWLEMHPDSRLKELLDYLVPMEQAKPRPLKLARDISFLDPCCGSMHFGLIAFDLFVEMYREELEKAGQTGWPPKPSVGSDDEIAASIIAHNVHGIDIDLRAVQLSALTLLLRARTLNSQCHFTDRNLACANVEEITGGRLEEFIKQAQFSHPIYERILRALASRLKDSNNFGSLMRLERNLEMLVTEERNKAELDKQFTLAFPGLTPEQFKSQAGIEEFFDILTDQILRHLDNFVRASRTHGTDPGHFVSETTKGLRFMRIIQQSYDVVTTNPPYLSARKMNKRLATIVADQYAEARSDLYAAFIVRCKELLTNSGLMGMLTMQSFMFISSYEDLRAELRKEIAIETLAQFGGGLFAVGNPGTLQTAAFVLRLETDQRSREDQLGAYFRLVKEPDADSKNTTFQFALAKARAGERHPVLFRYLQKDFNAIPGHPWVYWVSAAIRELFLKHDTLQKRSRAVTGINTGDNFRFRRYWWECMRGKDGRWLPFVSGGDYRKWFGNYDYLVHSDFEQMSLLHGSAIRSRDYWFREGLTFCLISSTGFNARYLPPGYVFSSGGNCWFSDTLPRMGVLGYLNSTLASYLLLLLNPTINYTVGSVGALPLADFNRNDLIQLVEKKVGQFRLLDSWNEATASFRIPPPCAGSELAEGEGKFVNQLLDQNQIDDIICEAFLIDASERLAIEEDLKTIAVEDGESFQPNPEEIDLSQKTIAQSWISYAFGTVLGRFEIGKAGGGLGRGDFSPEVVAAIRKLIDSDGIMPSDPNQPEDIVKRILGCIELMLGQNAGHGTIRGATGDDGDPEELLRGWIDRFFWKYHCKLYRNRPIYWPLQSPKKKFTVWIFHERFTKDTLFHIRRNIVEVRLRLLEREIGDKRKEAATNKAAAKQLDKLRDLEDDLRELSKRLKDVADRGYTPHIDDGVLLNAAPLHSLLPSWPETKKAWQELENEEYEWAQQAMEYWPDRVKKKCKTDKSFAIAHGLA